MATQAALHTLANERVSILEVCRQIGLEVPDEVVLGRGSLKILCPFGDVFHPDGGSDPSFRIYSDTGTAYCFICQKYYTAVSLYAEVKGVSRNEAARSLLESVGYRPSLADFSLTVVEKPPDSASLGAALQLYAGRICPDWEVRQFDPEVSQALLRCLSLLPRVRTSQHVSQWLEVTKKVMRTALEAEEKQNEF